MKNISLPKKFIVEEVDKGKKAKVIIEPCFPGYGLTLGTALRRVLLSSLPGGAVTAVKIKGVQHEFSTINQVTEDVVNIILNLKKLRVKMHTDEPVVLKLKVKGEKAVTGADIEPSADAEIINKNEVIATLNDKDGDLEMEITVAKGIGYVPVEEREESKEKGEIGLILVDSIFTPVLNVGLEVGTTRVGQKVDYDKIILDIETDGTIDPESAVQKAAEILVNQFSWLMEGGREEIPEVDLEAPVAIPEPVEAELVSTQPELEEEIAQEMVAAEDKPKKRGRPKKVD
ncbi:MAG TPA: DNA-directed RNA polymerase subunit alpha [bacterium]|nr:DNA-directed RNA polymerase subunit alpha [bacterium]HPN81116.1 DNA-directed RNA polymerase subunit alpha [bacterium]HPW39134.1 DNA-directed RNA polymerase subunit alpha [bacterium]